LVVAGVPPRGGVDEVEVALDQFRKGSLGPGGGKFPQQRQVVSRHSLIKWPPNGKPTMKS
jgi:hypothetical protein